MTCPCNNPQAQSNESLACTTATGVDVRDIPVDQFEQAPDYFMTIRVKQDKHGTVKYQPMITPGAAVMDTSLDANKTYLPTNNPSLTVEPGQVLPVYLENTGNKVVMHPADATHPAQFLVLEVKDNGMAVCQNSGWVHMPVGHKYNLTSNYYLSSTEGQVTTDANETGQYLFEPVGRFTLALDIKRG